MLLAPVTFAGNFQLYYIACLAIVSAQLPTLPHIVVGLTGITRAEGIRLLLFECLLSLMEIEKNETRLV